MTIEPSVRNGIIVGAIVAFAQATVTVGLLKWSFRKPSFFKVWAAGMLGRLVVFAVTAAMVYRTESLNFAATLLTLAVGTMLFMILEVSVFLKPK